MREIDQEKIFHAFLKGVAVGFVCGVSVLLILECSMELGQTQYRLRTSAWSRTN